ncbi:MAG: GDP-mannose 4,6-dehydratase [Candidatus Omnitrophica bacterium]|nr:GDP-mannose 4,6-dehydratase [Candidatus Omnitrophota bacterium]
MKILITGVAGFIGAHLAERLIKQGHQVLGLDILLRDNRENIANLESAANFDFFEGSILDQALLEKLIPQCEVVYHLAAAVGVEHIIGDILKVISVNVEGTKLVAALAYKYKKKLIFTSTSEIYGKSPQAPFKEDDNRLLGPTTVDRWVYSSTKALGEYILIGYRRQGLAMSIVRFFNAYGPKLDIEGSGRVISRFIVQALANKQITIIGDGKQSRCFTYVDDVLDGLIKCAETKAADGEIFNIGRTEETSILDLAQLIKEATGSQSEIVHIEASSVYGAGYEDIPRRVPDIEKAQRLLGFAPKISIEKGLEKTIAWFKQRLACLAERK